MIALMPSIAAIATMQAQYYRLTLCKKSGENRKDISGPQNSADPEPGANNQIKADQTQTAVQEKPQP